MSSALVPADSESPPAVAHSLGKLANYGILKRVEIIEITPTDTRYTVREALRRSPAQRALLMLPWDVDHGWESPLDYEVLGAAAQDEQIEIAWVIPDFEKRSLPKEMGFPVFASRDAAERYVEEHGAFPEMKLTAFPARPTRPRWAEAPEPPPLPVAKRRPWWMIPLQGGLLLVALAAIGVVAFLILPSAKIYLVPEGATYSAIVPISVDPELTQVDLQNNLIPSRRVGDEFEAYAEIGTSGLGISFAGRAAGNVVFTNQLGQDYQIPEGTLVRTSAGSYPVRFETTADVTVPALGQATAPVQALEEGPRGNIGAYQINFVEGTAGVALKVTNPDPITGAESQEVAAVSEADRERVWALAAERVLAEAYNGLQSDEYLEPGEFLPRQSLVIQATPKEAYTHLIGEQSETLGLSLRLLATGQAVNANDIQKVAYRRLLQQIPEGYRLTDTRFEIGESAEEDVGPGWFTFYVTAHGYATPNIEPGGVRAQVQGMRAEDVAAHLEETYPLARPPEVTVSPSWFPFMPRLPLNIDVTVARNSWGGE